MLAAPHDDDGWFLYQPCEYVHPKTSGSIEGRSMMLPLDPLLWPLAPPLEDEELLEDEDELLDEEAAPLLLAPLEPLLLPLAPLEPLLFPLAPLLLGPLDPLLLPLAPLLFPGAEPFGLPPEAPWPTPGVGNVPSGGPCVGISPELPSSPQATIHALTAARASRPRRVFIGFVGVANGGPCAT
jgi:hypothetical protein